MATTADATPAATTALLRRRGHDHSSHVSRLLDSGLFASRSVLCDIDSTGVARVEIADGLLRAKRRRSLGGLVEVRENERARAIMALSTNLASLLLHACSGTDMHHVVSFFSDVRSLGAAWLLAEVESFGRTQLSCEQVFGLRLTPFARSWSKIVVGGNSTGLSS